MPDRLVVKWLAIGADEDDVGGGVTTKVSLLEFGEICFDSAEHVGADRYHTFFSIVRYL